MKKGVKVIKREFPLPKGVEVTITDIDFSVKGPKGQLTRSFPSYLKMSQKDGIVKFMIEGDRKKTALCGTMKSHLRNMSLGVLFGYEGRMKFVHSHFPMKVSSDKGALVVQNFLGERADRRITTQEGVDVKVDKDEIIFTGIDKEQVGHSMSNIEQKTKVKRFDRRVFQDGIYITQKPKALGEIETEEKPKEEKNEKPKETPKKESNEEVKKETKNDTPNEAKQGSKEEKNETT